MILAALETLIFSMGSFLFDSSIFCKAFMGWTNTVVMNCTCAFRLLIVFLYMQIFRATGASAQ